MLWQRWQQKLTMCGAWPLFLGQNHFTSQRIEQSLTLVLNDVKYLSASTFLKNISVLSDAVECQLINVIAGIDTLPALWKELQHCGRRATHTKVCRHHSQTPETVCWRRRWGSSTSAKKEVKRSFIFGIKTICNSRSAVFSDSPAQTCRDAHFLVVMKQYLLIIKVNS